MKRFQKLILASTMVLGMVLATGTAQAQVSSSTIAGPLPPTTAGVELTLTGIVQSSLQLYVDGTFSSSTDGVNADGVATVDFATFHARTNNTTVPVAQGGGMLKRTSLDDGVVVFTNLDAWVLVGGQAAAASIVLSKVSETAALVNGTRYASGVANPWTNMGAGTAVAAGPITICSGLTPCTSGLHFPHQLAVDIPDTFAGTFTQIVRYDATL